MSIVNQKRTRSERVARLEFPPGLVERTWEYLRRTDVLVRLGLCLLTIALLWMVTGTWSPPLGYRSNYTPLRDIVAKVRFNQSDPAATLHAQSVAARNVRYVYEQDKEPLVQLRAALKNRVLEVVGAKSLDETDKKAWSEFFAPPPPNTPALTPAEKDALFQPFREALASPDALAKLEKAVASSMASFEQTGLMERLPVQQQEHDQGNQEEIVVHPKGNPQQRKIVKVSDVLIGEADALKKNLYAQIDSPVVAARVFDWLRTKLPSTTLSYKDDETQTAIQQAMAAVGEMYKKFAPGEVLAPGGRPITPRDLDLLRLEHETFLKQLQPAQRVDYSLAVLGMFVALMTLCGVYIMHYEHRVVEDLRRLATVTALAVATVGLAVLASGDSLRAELVPLLLFGMTIAIAYDHELALLLTAAVALVIVVSIGQGLSEFVILNASAASAILLLGRVRSRTKLFHVSLCVGLVAFFTTIGVGTLDQQPFLATTLKDAFRYGLWSIIAVWLAMSGLLPFIERLFGVQTELSLLELGDVAHPLLQELVRRAPGTYNHSINVASIAEAAAESIGANGLLVRVGAYFHDIGKMLKPGYFVENQGHEANRHETLMPAMSTLIIIAHIKDGADLARQHRLPEPIVDFILQHHGTTLVEYFYRRANEQSEANPNASEVDESAFRYPGPKPQTKEAAVLMLADAVEGASRALVEPTPARIESLVHDMAMKRLLDGQFDSCALTLKELATVEESLAKSLTAVYHGRVKYPDQRPATVRTMDADPTRQKTA